MRYESLPTASALGAAAVLVVGLGMIGTLLRYESLPTASALGAAAVLVVGLGMIGTLLIYLTR